MMQTIYYDLRDIKGPGPARRPWGAPPCSNAPATGVVDGGPCVVGVESTILDMTCEPPRLLRPGGLPVEELERLIGPIAVDRAVRAAMPTGYRSPSPS